MTLFTVKYAPQNTAQVLGQENAIAELKDFVVQYKQQAMKAALVYGPIGSGKTSSVHALAKELNYDLLEVNSSDLRNQEQMNSFLNAALGQQSLFFRPKIILIDEIDAISGVHDRGCIPALLKAIATSSFPVIITANDPFDSKFKPLQKASRMIHFKALDYKTIANALSSVCAQEKITADDKALNTLARQADGDLRGALIDLYISINNREVTFSSVMKLSDRKRTTSILSALAVIFKSSSVANALPALDDIDVDLNTVFFWLDENLPKEYTTPASLAKAYEHLSRADVFNGRIRRQQHWRFLVYINNLLTAGISSAKDERNTQFIPYRPTMRILRMWQAKMKNAKKKEIAEKLATATHTSRKVALQQIPYLQAAFRRSVDDGMIAELELTDEEVEWLRK
ncbi:MAG: replication factor C large subunit [Nanoarchaeota archaeon]|nr:replication factor C large subunit [Nanoarchaeota archaeon]